MNSNIRIAMGQMLVEGGRLEANLSRACNVIHEAARNGCDIVVLPECLDLGWTYPGARELAHPIPGYCCDILCQAAKDADIHVVVGLTERSDARLYNAAVMISNAGEVILHHRKIHELPFALQLYSVGDKLSVAETKFGRVGIPICADLRPKHNPLGNSLGLMGARLLLSPSAWAVPPEHDNTVTPYGKEWVDPYTELASKYQMVVAGVSNVGMVKGGEWDGWKCIGCSVAVGSDGEILAQGKYGEDAEELLTFEVKNN